MNAEEKRREELRERRVHGKRWGPYQSERHGGPVREDYSPDGPDLLFENTGAPILLDFCKCADVFSRQW